MGKKNASLPFISGVCTRKIESERKIELMLVCHVLSGLQNTIRDQPNLCKVHKVSINHVSNAWSCNATLYDVYASENAVLDALGTRRSFRSRRVVLAVEDA